MSKITPHLWFDTQAKEAAEFYSEVFPDSQVTNVTTLRDTPSGDCDVVSFTVWGHDFMAISAGPLFEINPSISFIVNFDPDSVPDAAEALDRVWAQLADGGNELMPLGEYPFSKRYGWIADRYGVSWQLILSDTEGDPRPTIVPSLMFTGQVCGKAAEAREFYISVFGDSERGQSVPYPEGSEPDEPGTTMFSDFRLADGWFAAMDSAHDHGFGFNEAVSLMISCSDQDGDRPLLGAALRRPRGRAVRLAQGPLRRLLAGHPGGPGRDDGQGHARADRPGHPGLPADEEVRPGRPARRLRRPGLRPARSPVTGVFRGRRRNGTRGR